MKFRSRRRFAPAVMLAAFLLTVTPAAFADTLFIIPAGLGCPDFNLGLAFNPATGGHTETFTDKNGNTVRVISAVSGVILTYTNYGTDPNNPVAGKSVSIKTSGHVTTTVTNPDGTLTVTARGHSGLILFPSDTPAGPTTTQYIGKVVYNIDADENLTLVSTSGQARDICAALA